MLAEIEAAAHVQPLDRFAAEEAARLRAFIALLDKDVLENGLRGRKGEPRSLLELRVRASKQLERYFIPARDDSSRDASSNRLELWPTHSPS